MHLHVARSPAVIQQRQIQFLIWHFSITCTESHDWYILINVTLRVCMFAFGISVLIITMLHTHTVLCVTNCCNTLIEQSFLFHSRRSFMTVSVCSPVCTRTVLAVILVGWIGPMSVLKLVLSNSLQYPRCICSADYVLRESAKIT